MITLLVQISAAVHASATRADCFPTSKQLLEQVVATPSLRDGGILVVVEETTCDETHPPNPLAITPVVPPEFRRGLPPAEVAAARAAGRELAPPIGPEAFEATVDAVVASVRDVLPSTEIRVVHGADGVVQVLAGDAAFLTKRVAVEPSGCVWGWSEPWTIDTAQYCIMDQIGDATATPRLMFPGWAGSILNQVHATDVPLLQALIDIYTVNGVQPYAFFFRSQPGEPDGLPRRRLSIDVFYPTFPDGERTGAILPRKPGAPRKVFREIPGDTDAPHNPVPKVKAKPPKPSEEGGPS